MKCTIYFTVSPKLNAYVAFCIPKCYFFLRDKGSASEKPSDPSVLTSSVGEKSPLVQNRAEAHPDTHSPHINEFSLCSRASLSFLSDLYFGADSLHYTTWPKTYCVGSDWQPTSLGPCSRHSPSLSSTSLSGDLPWLDQSSPHSLRSLHFSSPSHLSCHSPFPAAAVLY